MVDSLGTKIDIRKVLREIVVSVLNKVQSARFSNRNLRMHYETLSTMKRTVWHKSYLKPLYGNLSI